MGTSRQEATAEFTSHRPTLLALSYRMLGSRSEAEDIVQEAWLRWASAADVSEPLAWLRTVVTRLCLDELRSARVRRQAYVGPWLPEPLHEADPALGPPEAVLLRETASLGLLVLLERLTPAERAVFVLREAFALPYAEVADAVGRTAAACRQLHARGAMKIGERPEPAGPGRRALLEALLEAMAIGDIPAVTALLTDGCVLQSDGGGVVRAALRPVLSATKVARLLVGLAAQLDPATTPALERLSGVAALVLRTEGRVTGVLSVDTQDERASGIWIIVHPGKLDRL